MTANTKTYVGIYNDEQGGMTHIGMVIKDAWMFGILPETETCEGWAPGQIQVLYEKVYAAWEPYAHLPSMLPADLKERHTRIHATAMEIGRKNGWNPELGEDD
jgi:hypothetical protein